MLTDKELKNLHHLDQFGLFCDYDEFEQIARAVIEANNTRVLADLKPVGGCVMENGNAVDCYAGDQVSALIQRNAELEVRIKQLDAQAKHHGPVIVSDAETQDPNTIYGECFGIDWIYEGKSK